MFDTYVTRQSPSYPQSVHVTEKRAPTDESVKILREMETAARDSIVEAVRVDDNEFKCVIHQMQSATDCQNLYKAIFTLNGKRFVADYCADIDKDKYAHIKGLRDAIATVIANESLKFLTTRKW